MTDSIFLNIIKKNPHFTEAEIIEEAIKQHFITAEFVVTAFRDIVEAEVKENFIAFKNKKPLLPYLLTTLKDTKNPSDADYCCIVYAYDEEQAMAIALKECGFQYLYFYKPEVPSMVFSHGLPF